MGNEHLSVEINLTDYTVKEDMGSWGLARALIEEYELDSPLQLELIGEMNNVYVNKLRQRLEQENGGINYYTEGSVVKVPSSKWQTLLVVGLILPKETGSNPPPTELSAEPEVVRVQTTVTIEKPAVTQWLLTNSDVFGDNQNRSTSDIKAIVVHQTYSTTASSAWNTCQGGRGSVQYLVDKDGTIYQLLPEKYSGYHIRRGHETSWVNNLNSIGIEFVGMAYEDRENGKRENQHLVYEDLTSTQQASSHQLLLYLMNKYNIPRSNIFKHPEVQRKNETEAQSVQIP